MIISMQPQTPSPRERWIFFWHRTFNCQPHRQAQRPGDVAHCPTCTRPFIARRGRFGVTWMPSDR